MPNPVLLPQMTVCQSFFIGLKPTICPVLPTKFALHHRFLYEFYLVSMVGSQFVFQATNPTYP